MNFFDFVDAMKQDPSIRIKRKEWPTSDYYIFWNAEHNIFIEHLKGIETEWGNDTFIDDLQANDWIACERG